MSLPLPEELAMANLELRALQETADIFQDLPLSFSCF
jgi:hypothetical protein